MLASRLPCRLINPPWRACIRFAITRNKSLASTHHELNRLGLKWTKLRAEPLTKAPASIVSAKAGKSEKSIGYNSTTTGRTTQSKKYWFVWKKPVAPQARRDKLPTSTTKKNLGTKSKKTPPEKKTPPKKKTPSKEKTPPKKKTPSKEKTPPKKKTPSKEKTPPKQRKKKNIPAVGSGLGVPERVFDELVQTPINTAAFEIDSLGREYELRYIDCKPAPMTARIYHPEASSSLNGNKILYLPSAIPNSFFPSHDSIISTLSKITSSTIIYPVPADTPEPFPQSIQNLLRIYDATTDKAPTAIITSGIAATTATAMAMTEPNIKGIGIWSGIFDLTKSSATSTRWNRPLEHWEHLPTNALPPVPKSTNSLAITRDEFKALRRHYYPNPETWLDPFASPLAFFMRSNVVFSRMNLTEIMGEGIRQQMVGMKSYSESDWEAEVYIYPRIDLMLRTWNTFPPASRMEDFPKIRIVAPEKQEDAEENGNDVAFTQAEKFGNISKKGLASWLKSRLWSTPNALGTSASTSTLDAELDEETEAMKEIEFEANMMIQVDTLSKEDTGVEEVNLMARWIKWVLEGPSARD